MDKPIIASVLLFLGIAFFLSDHPDTFYGLLINIEKALDRLHDRFEHRKRK